MQLNDYAFDAQRLLPFVTRLACADTPAIELERAAYIRSKVATAHSFEYGLKVLEGALAIGWQADTLGVNEAKTRLERFSHVRPAPRLWRTARSSRRSRAG